MKSTRIKWLVSLRNLSDLPSYQYFQIQIFVISAWIDNRLDTTVMNSSNPKNPRLLLPDDAFHCFWSPSLIFDNSKDGKHFMLSVPNKMMTVYNNQTVLMASRFSVKVRCRFDLSRYPMDVQKCRFKMRLCMFNQTIAFSSKV